MSSSDTSCDLDVIPTSLLKSCLDVLIKPITIIVNMSLSEGSFPSTFKHALVKPFLKKHNLPQDELSSYRPISNLNFVSKVLERIIHARISSHLESFPSITPFQSYCSISTDRAYIEPNVKHSCEENIQTFTEMEIFNCLDNLKFTATGLDGLPAWFLRLAAPIFAEPITNLVNKSVCTSIVPEQWKRALINPIPKVKNPKELGDYRPISITPVLSRITEKMVVRKYIYPAMLDPPPSLSFADQFAFRPTGSTTAALITLLRIVTTLLETNPYVIVYVRDFSKAFDTVRHSTLLEKMALLNLPDQIYNWFVNYYSEHSHCTSFCGAVSELADITASIIQGSGGGPASYAVNASDLKTVHSGNELVKFADDTDLVVAASNVHTCIKELDNIKAWAERNNLKLNESKSVEIVFRNPRSKTSSQINHPPTPMGIVRMKEIKTLGVTISDTFSIKTHVNNVISSCSQALYAMKILKSQGLTTESLQIIFQSTILSRLLYASQAWYGFANENEINRLEAFLRKSIKSSFALPTLPSFKKLCSNNDDKLFASVRGNKNHVLSQFLPPTRETTYNLRPRAHNLQIPSQKTNKLVDKNFLNRVLSKNSY